MLEFSLYDGECLQIGDNVKLVIDRCIDDGKKTRLGIQAPKEVIVLRQELTDCSASKSQNSAKIYKT